MDENIKKNNNNEHLKEVENIKDKNINNNKNTDVTLISVSNNNNILEHNYIFIKLFKSLRNVIFHFYFYEDTIYCFIENILY